MYVTISYRMLYTVQSTFNPNTFSYIFKRFLPIKVMPCFERRSGSFGFSEAWPHPAQTALQNNDICNHVSDRIANTPQLLLTSLNLNVVVQYIAAQSEYTINKLLVNNTI